MRRNVDGPELLLLGLNIYICDRVFLLVVDVQVLELVLKLTVEVDAGQLGSFLSDGQVAEQLGVLPDFEVSNLPSGLVGNLEGRNVELAILNLDLGSLLAGLDVHSLEVVELQRLDLNPLRTLGVQVDFVLIKIGGRQQLLSDVLGSQVWSSYIRVHRVYRKIITFQSLKVVIKFLVLLLDVLTALALEIEVHRVVVQTRDFEARSVDLLDLGDSHFLGSFPLHSDVPEVLHVHALLEGFHFLSAGLAAFHLEVLQLQVLCLEVQAWEVHLGFLGSFESLQVLGGIETSEALEVVLLKVGSLQVDRLLLRLIRSFQIPELDYLRLTELEVFNRGVLTLRLLVSELVVDTLSRNRLSLKFLSIFGSLSLESDGLVGGGLHFFERTVLEVLGFHGLA